MRRLLQPIPHGGTQSSEASFNTAIRIAELAAEWDPEYRLKLAARLRELASAAHGVKVAPPGVKGNFVGGGDLKSTTSYAGESGSTALEVCVPGGVIASATNKEGGA